MPTKKRADHHNDDRPVHELSCGFRTIYIVAYSTRKLNTYFLRICLFYIKKEPTTTQRIMANSNQERNPITGYHGLWLGFHNY